MIQNNSTLYLGQSNGGGSFGGAGAAISEIAPEGKSIPRKKVASK